MIHRENNEIKVTGELENVDLNYFLSYVYTAIEKAGFPEIILDFQECTKAFASTMVGICTQVLAYRNSNIDFLLNLPQDQKLSRLFLNSNWAHLIDPRRYDGTSWRGHTQVPATSYRNSIEQSATVEKILDTILGAVPELNRRDFAAVEWSIYELMDNVLTHADAPSGGLVQVTTFQRNKKRIQVAIADAGLGIPKTLNEHKDPPLPDTDALEQAIKEGVTRDSAIGQGNGLFGSYQICTQSKGRFFLSSQHAQLSSTNGNLHISHNKIPYDGTLIVAEVNFSDPGLLGEALKFDGRLHSPLDRIESHYEAENTEDLYFELAEEAESLGNRPSGKFVRNKLLNLSNTEGVNRIIVDCRNIPIISSSFADEVFGKLFIELGPIRFNALLGFQNVELTVQQLIDKAITQRLAVSQDIIAEG